MSQGEDRYHAGARAHRAGPHQVPRQAAGRGQALRPRPARSSCSIPAASSRRTGSSRAPNEADTPGRRRRHRRGHAWAAGPSASWPTTTRSRPARGARRPCRRSCASRRRRPACGPHALPGRRRRRADLRADQDLPRPLPRRPDLLQRGPALGRGPAGLHPVRPVAGGLGLSAGADRSGHHGRGQGLALRGQPAHGRDGDRREDDAGRAGRRADALQGLRAAATCWPPPTRRRSSWPAATSRTCRARSASAPARASAVEAKPGRLHRRDRALRPAQVLRHVRGDRPGHRRRLLVRDQAAVRGRDHRRAGPDRRARGRHRRQSAEGEGRRAHGRTPPTRRRASSGSATPSTSRSSTWPTSRASWWAPRSSGRASSATGPR